MPKSVLIFTIPGKPMAQKRHQTTMGGKHTFNPSKGDKQVIAQECRIAANQQEWRSAPCPMALKIYFYFRRPKSRKSLNEKYHTQTPDLDNCIKLYVDAMESVCLLHNDKQICSLVSGKFYTDKEPYTAIELRPISQ